MKLIVGLGNPGGEYERTRHNVGFMIADELAARTGISLSEKRFKARLGRGRLGSEQVVMIEPQAFMNLSGESVGPAAGFYKIPTEAIIVIHDDIDLDLGRIKLKQGGGHGGHNGLRSLLMHLPDAEFIRVRVGVGRPPPRWDPAAFVLAEFLADERPSVVELVKKAADAVEAIVIDGLSRAMILYNRTAERSAGRKEDENGHRDT